MAENSKIEWCDHTFNPWIGCHKVSNGCKNCYAENLMDKRYGRAEWGPQGQRVRTSPANWRKPLAWNRQAEAEGRRYRVFCASLADVFEDKPDQPELADWRGDLWSLICDTPNLDWLLLTKRPENVMRMAGYLYKNIWIGTSVENQETADQRIPELLKIPARVRFLSCEPLLGAIDLSKWTGNNFVCRRCGFCASDYQTIPLDRIPIPNCGKCDHSLPSQRVEILGRGLHWVIVGGESGPKARPMHPDWARSIRDQCQAANVPFFFKQWGEGLPLHVAATMPGSPKAGQVCWPTGDRPYGRVGKKVAGRLLDGREWSEFPVLEAM